MPEAAEEPKLLNPRVFARLTKAHRVAFRQHVDFTQLAVSFVPRLIELSYSESCPSYLPTLLSPDGQHTKIHLLVPPAFGCPTSPIILKSSRNLMMVMLKLTSRTGCQSARTEEIPLLSFRRSLSQPVDPHCVTHLLQLAGVGGLNCVNIYLVE